MNIKTYIEQARSTAIYDDPFIYPALGLAGEIGETIDKITALTPHKISDKSEVTKELGDVLWYIVNIVEDTGTSFDDIIRVVTNHFYAFTFSELKIRSRSSYDKRSALVKLPIYVGKIAEVAKKMIRDSAGMLPGDKLPVVQNSLAQILICLFNIAREWDINMDDVAQVNIDKLLSRKERGVLRGDGDDR